MDNISIIKTEFNNRAIHLYEKISDINFKNVKIMSIHNGFYYVKNGQCFDVEGRFDISFDSGLWTSKLYQNSILAN